MTVYLLLLGPVFVAGILFGWLFATSRKVDLIIKDIKAKARDAEDLRRRSAAIRAAHEAELEMSPVPDTLEEIRWSSSDD